MQDKIKEIRDACISANPEIVELKFGCEVEYVGRKDMGIYISGFFVKENTSGMYLTYFSGVDEDSRDIMPFTTTLKPKECKIIGRPIRLADVLLVMGDDYAVDGLGDIRAYNGAWATVAHWNLDDNLENQSEETINFIHDILWKNEQ